MRRPRVLKEDFRMVEDLERMWEINQGPLPPDAHRIDTKKQDK